MDGKSPATVSQDLLSDLSGIDAILDALGDRTRRMIFERLGDGPQPVVSLAHDLPVSRPAVSQHLKVLKNAGLVRDHRDGTRRIYELDIEGVAALRSYIDRFWGVGLAAFKRAAERRPGTGS